MMNHVQTSQRRFVAVVDDDDDVRISTAMLLERAGYDVRAFVSGDDFLASGADEELFGVVLDLDMAGASGLDVLRAMQARETAPPIVILSGSAGVGEAVVAMKAGALDVIEKPCPPAQLIDSIENAAKRRDEETKIRKAESRSAAIVADLPMRLRQVLGGIAAGKLNKIIAYELGLSVRTVEAYRSTVLHRLQVRSTAGAVRIALEAGLIACN